MFLFKYTVNAMALTNYQDAFFTKDFRDSSSLRWLSVLHPLHFKNPGSFGADSLIHLYIVRTVELRSDARESYAG